MPGALPVRASDMDNSEGWPVKGDTGHDRRHRPLDQQVIANFAEQLEFSDVNLFTNLRLSVEGKGARIRQAIPTRGRIRARPNRGERQMASKSGCPRSRSD